MLSYLAGGVRRCATAAGDALLATCGRSVARAEESLHLSGMLGKGKRLTDYLQANKLADRGETVFGVLDRATRFLAESGARYANAAQVEANRRAFLSRTVSMELVLGSPILTNAGRRDATVSACSIPPFRLSKMTREQIAEAVAKYHRRGMGTGFALDDVEDPVDMVKTLNGIAVGEVQRGEIERSCGNMGVLSVDHPRVLDYIRVRINHPEIREWKFNLSVNITDEFMRAFESGSPFRLQDGSQLDPRMLMRQIAENAHATGDPGIIFMDRINQLNRLPHIGDYKTVVPCGEVSLYAGEVCQFSYLNCASFVADRQIDLPALRSAVHLLVLMLDNAVEANISRLPTEESANVVEAVRRIGVGVCGFAEALQAMGLPYDSEEGRRFGADLMSLINYESKRASVELARTRGPFPAFDDPRTRRELFLQPFASQQSSLVSADDWQRLEREFQIHRIRNLATTILPPTGRSSVFAGVTGSIEPPFRLVPDEAFRRALREQCQIHGYRGDLQSVFSEVLETGSLQGTGLPEAVKEVFRTALELSPESHLAMVASFQRHVDEGISKTVNLPHDASVEDVIDTLVQAFHSNLKGITVYRDGCRSLQPLALGSTQKDPKVSGKILDPLFGPLQIEGKLWKLLQAPLLQRLKTVHQNGTNYLIDPRQATSRFEHSIGVMSLVRMLGGSERQQIAALLHDVGHTAFSHVIDLAFGSAAQDYHEQIQADLLQQPAHLAALAEVGIDPGDLSELLVPLTKGASPSSLSADRIDYCLRDLKAVNRIFQPEYSSILNNLQMGSDGAIECRNLDTAKLLFRKFLEVNQQVYFQPRSEVAAITLATILQGMVREGSLQMADLMLDEGQLIDRIRSSAWGEVFAQIGPEMRFAISSSATPYPAALRKLRYLDPRIAGVEGTLTTVCEQSREQLAAYRETPTSVFYDIEALQRSPS